MLHYKRATPTIFNAPHACQKKNLNLKRHGGTPLITNKIMLTHQLYNLQLNDFLKCNTK